jgi:chromosome segregation ATPase
VTDHISALRAERDEANERIALLVQKYEHEAKQLEAERDQYRSDAGMREAQRDALFERLQVANAKMDTYERADGKLEAAIVKLTRERDRLLSANDTLVSRIEDLTEGYALEDTCPRVQCLTTSKRLKNQAYELQRELDALQVKYTDECFENERMQGVVEAAVEWVESWGCNSPDTKDEELALAINAYRAASSEANGISKLDPNSASSKQPHNHHRNIATNNPERNETDPAITSSTQDSNTDTDRETGHNDE